MSSEGIAVDKDRAQIYFSGLKPNNLIAGVYPGRKFVIARRTLGLPKRQRPLTLSVKRSGSRRHSNQSCNWALGKMK